LSRALGLHGVFQQTDKRLVEQAAAVRGQSVSDFAVSSLVQLSREIIKEANVTRLSARDRDRFLALISKDAQPNDALRSASRMRVADPPSTLHIDPLNPTHDRKAFACGVPSLDTDLHRFAGQNERAGLSQHFVGVDPQHPGAILGYYALSAGSIAFDALPASASKRLPRDPVPVAQLGRLAVATAARGRRVGETLLIDALSRVARVSRVAEEVGIHAIEVQAVDDSARGFYRRYGFVDLPDQPNRLYLPMTVV